MQRQFTATVYILHQDKVLLIKHEKYAKWMPPGGHLEPNELPHEAAIREALEEANVAVEILSQENIQLDTPGAKTIPRPHQCLLEQIPAYKDQPPHQHIDMIYLGRPLSKVTETESVRWFNLSEIEALPPNALFDDVKQLLLLLLEPRLGTAET